MSSIFKPIVVVLLCVIALINGSVAYNFYTHSIKPCQSDNLLVYSGTSENVPALLQEAQRDINQIMSGQVPPNVKHFASSADGGSKLYVSEKYEIIHWHSLATVGGVRGYMHGFTLRLRNDFPKEYSHTWFQAQN